MANDIVDVVYDNDDLIVPVGPPGETGEQGPPGPAGGTTAIMQTFANAAARAAATPTFDGQIGVQLDTNIVYQATGLTVGNWTAIYATRVFANDAARTAATPDFISQVGVQTDTNAVYVSTGLSAGNWTTNITVSSSGSSTDNAIVRWDGTTGRVIQNSNVIVSDTGSIDLPNNNAYKIDSAFLLYYDSGGGAIEMGNIDATSGTNTVLYGYQNRISLNSANTIQYDSNQHIFRIGNAATTFATLDNNLTFGKEVAHIISASASTTAATAGSAITIETGLGNGAASGALVLRSANETSTDASGVVTLSSGTTVSAGSGTVSITTGAVSTLGASGALSLSTGTSATSGNTGAISITSGGSTLGNSGAISLVTGTASGTVGTVTVSPGGVLAITFSNTLITNALSLTLRTGTATAGTSPLKFVAGTNLTAPEAGAMEWDGTRGYLTQTSGPTRKTIAYVDDSYIPVNRTVYVDVTNGDDTAALAATTASGGRFDVPYQTKAAAMAAVKSLMTPTATNRVLISVAMETSSLPIEFLSDTSGVDWDLNGGSLNITSGATAAIDDGNFIVDAVICNAHTLKTTGGTGAGVRTRNSSSLLTIYANTISSTVSNAILCTSGTQIIEVSNTISCSANATTCVACSAGSQSITVFGNTGITATGTTSIVASCAAGTQRIKSKVLSGSVDVLSGTGGTQIIEGDLTSSSVSSDTVITCSGATQYIQGNSSIGVGFYLEMLSGACNINGNFTTTGLSPGVQISGGTLNILGNITSAGPSCHALDISGSSVVTVIGNLTCTSNSGRALSASGTPTVNILGNLSSVQGDCCFINISGGTINITGNLSATNSGVSAVDSSSTGGTIVINGNLSSVGVNDATVISSGASGLMYIKNGTITNTSDEAVNISNGSLFLENCRVKTTSAGEHAIVKSGGNLYLKNTTLIGGSGGYSISSPSTQTVVLYGANEANLGLDPAFAITTTVGTLTIDTNVV